MQPTSLRLIFLLFLIGPLLIGLIFLFRRYTDLPRRDAYLALIGSLIAGGVLIFYRTEAVERVTSRGNRDEIILSAVAAGVSVIFLAAFVLRLWGRWVGEKATAEERQPGLPGVRVWFSTGNVVVGLILVLTLWFGFDYPALLLAVLVCAALAAYPLLRMESPVSTSVSPPAPVADDLSAEREKILAMLEAGKLTPDESAELLQALRETSQPPARQVPLTGGQRLMLIGAALVGLGFFLPWLVINPGKEAGRMMNKMQSSMKSSFNGSVNFPGGMNFPGMEMKTSSISISGGDIPRGLGWAALLLALTAAFLPYVATTLDATTARTVRLLCLALGSFILLYLLTQNVRFVSLGLILAAGGYAVEIAGVLRERRAASV